MATLGKLGAGSVASRLFPKPGKKILRAVGQAVQASAFLLRLLRLVYWSIFLAVRFFLVHVTLVRAFLALVLLALGFRFLCVALSYLQRSA